MAQGLGSPLTVQPSRGHLDETGCLLPEVSPRRSGGPVAPPAWRGLPTTLPGQRHSANLALQPGPSLLQPQLCLWEKEIGFSGGSGGGSPSQPLLRPHSSNYSTARCPSYPGTLSGTSRTFPRGCRDMGQSEGLPDPTSH